VFRRRQIAPGELSLGTTCNDREAVDWKTQLRGRIFSDAKLELAALAGSMPFQD